MYFGLVFEVKEGAAKCYTATFIGHAGLSTPVPPLMSFILTYLSLYISKWWLMCSI